MKRKPKQKPREPNPLNGQHIESLIECYAKYQQLQHAMNKAKMRIGGFADVNDLMRDVWDCRCYSGQLNRLLAQLAKFMWREYRLHIDFTPPPPPKGRKPIPRQQPTAPVLKLVS